MSEQEVTQLEAAAPVVEPAAEVVPTETPAVEESVAAPETVDAALSSKADVVARLKEIAQQSAEPSREEIDMLRTVFYRLHNEEVGAARDAFVAAGGAAEEFVAEPDALETEYKELMAAVKERRAALAAEAEAQRQQNYERKLAIIEQIKAMVAAPDDIDKNYETFKGLQVAWREVGQIPAEHVTESWKNYQLQVEQFYDLLRLNHEMRAYDFKKNLEIKTGLCEAAEKLADVEDVISAFHQLQKLHQEFRETGPVAKELREQIWSRFKAASTVINKRHQDHFLAIKAEEEANLQQKLTLCDTVEALDLSALVTPNDWEEATKGIIALQAQWKTIGYTPRRQNQEIFERFRTACDKFFSAKTEHFRSQREEYARNLQLKTALCERAEALKDSTDWGNTTNALIALQAEWKTIGPVAYKVSEVIWRRFNTACNAFFAAKQAANNGQRAEEEANLTKKQDIIARLQQLVENGSENLMADVKALQAEWNETGHVPFRKKEKLYRVYREACDKLYETIHRSGAGRRPAAGGRRPAQQNLSPVQRLAKLVEDKKAEIKNYETNLTFLSTKSKSGNSLVADIERRIEQLKSELAELVKKQAESAE